MDPTSSNLKPSEVRAFNTADILRSLFKKSLSERQLPEAAFDSTLVALEKKINVMAESVQQCIAQSPQQKIEIVKNLLISTKNSPERQKLVQKITDLDPQLAALNHQGEKLDSAIGKLIQHFWDVTVKLISKNAPVTEQSLKPLYSELQNLQEESKIFEEKSQKIIDETVQPIVDGTANLTGQSPRDISVAASQITKKTSS